MQYSTKNITRLIIILTFISSTVIAEVNPSINNFNQQRPENINDQKWTSLKSVVQESKFLPNPEGVAGVDSNFGWSVVVNGDRAAIGATNFYAIGLVLILEFDGVTWNQKQVLKADDKHHGDNFGASVSLSGNRILIGATAFYNDENLDSVYVFDLINDRWQQKAKLTASDSQLDDHFGVSVSLFGDRALIGASGKAYIFDFNSDSWLQTEIIRSTGENLNDGFGANVSLFGNRALVGAAWAEDNGNRSGAAYVFDFNGVTWSQTAKIVADDGEAEDRFASSLSLSDNRVLIGAKNDDNGNSSNSGSAYIFDYIDGNWSQTVKLLAEDINSVGEFGFSVSLSGNRALISATDNYLGKGGAYIFELNSGVWSQTAKVVSDEYTDDFGFSVSLSGSRALIGAWKDREYGNNSGAGYVFDLVESAWIQSAKLTGGEASTYDNFGRSVSMLENKVMVSAKGDDDNGHNAGAVYVYNLIKGLWVQTAKLISDTNSSGEQFGHAISLSGNRVLIGANKGAETDTGSAYIFDLNDNIWSQTKKLSADDTGVDDEFGYSVDLLGDRAVIGAMLHNGEKQNSGAVYVFELIDGLWVQTAKLVAEDAQENDRFGSAVHLSNDRMLIGSYLDDDNGNNSGSAYIFDLIDDQWSQTAKLIAEDGFDDDWFGLQVSLSGNRALISASRNDENGEESGAVYVYDLVDDLWSQSAKLIANDIEINDRFGMSVSLIDDRAVIGTLRGDGNEVDTGSVYIFDLIDGTWSQTNKLLARDSDAFDNFGISMSISYDKILIGAAGNDDHGTNSGSAYIFNLNPEDNVFMDGFEPPSNFKVQYGRND